MINKAKLGDFHFQARDERDHHNQRIVTVKILVFFGACWTL